MQFFILQVARDLISQVNPNFRYGRCLAHVLLMTYNGVLTPPNKNNPPQWYPANPQTFELPPVLKHLTPPFEWKQTRCKANAQTSYPP